MNIPEKILARAAGLEFVAPGVRAAFEEGDVAVVDFAAFTVQNTRAGKLLKGMPYPDKLWAMLAGGGPTAVLRREGYIP